ncbi:MAG: sensor histidine kinase, partial [Actinomycetota bacterium]
MRNALRSLWREPRAPDNPGILWWDRWLVVAVIVTAILEGLLRDDLALPALGIALAVGVALTLLWRR